MFFKICVKRTEAFSNYALWSDISIPIKILERVLSQKHNNCILTCAIKIIMKNIRDKIIYFVF